MKNTMTSFPLVILSVAILGLCLTTRLPAEAPSVSEASQRPLLAAFYWLPDGITAPEVVRRVGSPYEQCEFSKCTVLTYRLADGSGVFVEAPDGTKVSRIYCISGAGWSQLYPVASLIRLRLEPNHALQRTEAGGMSFLHP